MPVDPYIAQGIAPIGRDLPQIGGMLQARNQANQQNALAQRQQGMLEQKFASQQQSEAVQWLFGATEFALQQKDPVAAARYLLPEAKRRGLVDPSYDGSTLTKDMLGQLNQQAKIMIGGGPQIDPTAKFNAEQRVELEKLRSQNDMTRSQYEAEQRAQLQRQAQGFQAREGQLNRDSRIALAQTAAAKPNAQAEKAKRDAQAKLPTIARVEGGIKRMESALTELGKGFLSNTGPVDQYIARYSKQGNELEQAVKSILPALTALTRVPGIGSQSDWEGRLNMLQLPALENYPDVNANALAGFKDFVADLTTAVRYAAEGKEVPIELILGESGASGTWTVEEVP